MNLPYFIAKRISKESKHSFSASIGRIAVISTAVGFTAILIAFMITVGFREKIREKVYNFAGHMRVTKYVLASSLDDQPVNLTSDFYQNWKDQYPYISHVQQYGKKAGLLKTDEEVEGVILKGVGEDYDVSRFESNIIEGTFPSLKEKGYSLDVLLSKRLADKLLLNVDDEVLMYFVQNPPRYRKLKVTGIYETGMEEFDDRLIIGDIGLIRRMNNWADSLTGGFEVFVDDIEGLPEMREDLFQKIDHDLYVDLISDRYIQVFDWLSLIDTNVSIYLGLILFVAGLNMTSILLILIMERTNMIGMLKAMGANKILIRRIFFINGVRLVLKGMIIGNVLAFSFGIIQKYWKVIPLDPKNYYMEYVPVNFNFPVLIGVNLLSLLIVSIALTIPIAIISRIHPIRSIKFS